MSTATKTKTTKESDIYDRQIRLWGADAQAKMKKASVLYINITGVSSEILKNLVLAGIRPIIYDERSVSSTEIQQTPCLFFTDEEKMKWKHQHEAATTTTNQQENNNNNSSNNATTENEKEGPSSSSWKKMKYTPMTVSDAIKPHVEELNPLLGECEIIHTTTTTTNTSNTKKKNAGEEEGNNDDSHSSTSSSSSSSTSIVDSLISKYTTSFFTRFSIIVASRITPSDAIKISNAIRRNNQQQQQQSTIDNNNNDSSSGSNDGTAAAAAATVDSSTSSSSLTKLFIVDTFGIDGGCIIDLNHKHIYHPEKGKDILLDATCIQSDDLISFDTLFHHVPLHTAINRFHKRSPPLIWMKYRSILQYVEHQQKWPKPIIIPISTINNNNNDKENDLDDDSDKQIKEFCQYIHEWITETSPTLAKEHELFQHPSDSKEQSSSSSISSMLYTLGRVMTCEIAPTCAVLGGLVGNEIIKAISLKGEPANNTILFDGKTCKAWTFHIKPTQNPTNPTQK